MEKESIFDGIDPEIMERVTSRRDALRGLGKLGAGAALASVPLAFATMARSAFAQQQGIPQEVVNILKFALTLERLEATFYREGVGSAINFPAGVLDLYTAIRDHEVAHVNLLEQVLTGAGASLEDVPNQFDFTAGGKFPNVFEDYDTFVLLSVAFEDTGVRAYKGQAPKLIDNDEILTTALKIHSVEARHAAKVRRLASSFTEEAWIPFTQPGAPAAVAPVWQGMGETVKYNINVPAVSGISPERVTEAWDEPLSMQEVLNIVQPFLPG